MRTVAQRLERLQRLLPLLACPACQGQLELRHHEELVCHGCHAHYPIRDGVPILLPSDMVAQGLGSELDGDEHISMHPYSPGSDALITEFQNGWVLDLGAGGKHIEHPNVVQVDVFRFPMVDVVASADALPFKAEVFDAVISQAVFEHLQHPAAAASEVWRTLKTDGTTKIDTAFLQPEHAYPHHYFNATEAGLKHWFRDFEIQWSGVEPYQHPKWALLWFLDVYLACMHPESQNNIYPRTVADVIAALKRLQEETPTPSDVELDRALSDLAPPSVRKLAAGVSVRAIKRVCTDAQHIDSTRSTTIVERRLSALTKQVEGDADYRKSIAQIHLITSDRTRFLSHEYELNRQDALINPGFIRPALHLMARELRRHLPNTWWQRLRHIRHAWTGQQPRSQATGVPPKATLTFWVTPTTPVALLDQFFSLVHQTHGDWAYLISTAPHHSAAMQRLMWELQQRDARVCLLSEEGIKAHLSSVAWVHLPPDAILAFDAVRQLASLLQGHPHIQHITADSEKWFAYEHQALRCWGAPPKIDDIYQESLSTAEPAWGSLILHNPQATKAAMSAMSATHDLNIHAHIPTVLYRLTSLATV